MTQLRLAAARKHDDLRSTHIETHRPELFSAPCRPTLEAAILVDAIARQFGARISQASLEKPEGHARPRAATRYSPSRQFGFGNSIRSTTLPVAWFSIRAIFRNFVRLLIFAPLDAENIARCWQAYRWFLSTPGQTVTLIVEKVLFLWRNSAFSSSGRGLLKTSSHIRKTSSSWSSEKRRPPPIRP